MTRIEHEPKRCASCGATHSQFQWPLLELVGHSAAEFCDSDEHVVYVERLELRRCSGFNWRRGVPCNSTLAVEVSPRKLERVVP